MAAKKKLRVGDVVGNKKLLALRFHRGKVAYWQVECQVCKASYLLSEYCCKFDRPCKFCHRAKTRSLVSGYFRIKSRRKVEY